MQTLVKFHLKPDCVPLLSIQLGTQALVVFYPHEPGSPPLGAGQILTHMVLMF